MKRKIRNLKRRVELWWLYLPLAERNVIDMILGLLVSVALIAAFGYACYVIGQGIVNPVAP